MEIKDYEYLHVFLAEHAFHQNVLVSIGNKSKEEIPWKNELTRSSWKEHID